MLEILGVTSIEFFEKNEARIRSKQPAPFHFIPQNHPRDTQDLSRVGLIPSCSPQCFLNQCLLDRGPTHLFIG